MRILCLALSLAAVSAGCGGDGDSHPFDWCGGAPPDASCYADRRDPGSENIALARAIVDRYIEEYPAGGLDWNWEEAVLMFSVTELYRVTGDDRYRAYAAAWIDSHIEAGYDIHTSDTCAPALTAAMLYLGSGEQRYHEVVAAGFDYLDNRALRTPDGGISHLGDDDLFGPTIWVDSLFMFGNLLTRWGEAREPARLDLMGDQFRLFSAALQSDSGLYVHAADWPGPLDTDIYWGRGNGWVTAAGYDYLRARTLRGEDDPEVASALARQVQAAIAAQDPATGMWWTILNRPGQDTNYLEASAGALFAYGLARGWRYDLLGSEVLPIISRAMQGVVANITRDDEDRPVVSNVSGPTTAQRYGYYIAIPVADDLGYGVGAFVLALIETSGLPLSEE